MMKKIQIAIDGPAGAGKSTIAKIVAEALNFTYIDTGAMYRAVTYKGLNENIQLDDAVALEKMLRTKTITLKPSEQGQLVFVDGENVSEAIRSNEVTSNVSQVAAHANIREILVDMQQQLAVNGGVVMDGRDIGTTVFPNAELKIFVTASPEVRAQRRYQELCDRGMPADYEEILRNVNERDYIDTHRDVSPLRQAPDALVLDNSALTIAEQRQWLLDRFKERSKE